MELVVGSVTKIFLPFGLTAISKGLVPTFFTVPITLLAAVLILDTVPSKVLTT